MPTQQAQKSRLEETEARARLLMNELGCEVLGKPLQELGWTFAFDNAKRRLGLCKWKSGNPPLKRISLSRHYVRLNGLQHRDESGLQVIEDVIRHEIAHAIDREQRGTSDHSTIWKKVCRQVGADPTRLYEGKNTDRAPGKYVATCPTCGKEYQYYRRPKRNQYCTPCNRNDDGRFDSAYRLELRLRSTGNVVLYGKEKKKAARKRIEEQAKKNGPTPAEEGYKYTAVCPKCDRQTGYRRKLKRRRACSLCCDAYAGGKFDERFELVISQNY